MTILPRLEDCVEMRGWQGLNRWYHEKNFKHANAFWMYTKTGFWTISLSRIVTSPLDHFGNCMTASVMGPKPLIDILKSSTVASLYGTMGRTMPSNVLTFGIAETVKFYALGQSIVMPGPLQERQSQQSLFIKNFIAGAIASSISTVIFYPLESSQRHVTIDMGCTKSRYIGVTHCVERRYFQVGGWNLYRGMSFFIIGSMLYRGLFFGLFEVGKVNLLPEGQHKFSDVFAVALLTSAAAGVIVQPIDALRMTFYKQAYDNWIKATRPLSFVTKVKLRTLIGILPMTLVKSVGPALCLTMFNHFKRDLTQL